MASQGKTGIGSYIEATTDLVDPALAKDETNYAALTNFKASNEEISVGSNGSTNSIVSYTTIRDGQTNKRVSFSDQGTMQLQFAWNVEDDLQVLLKAAAKSKARITVRENLSDGTVSYFECYVSSATKNTGDGNSVIMFDATAEITTEILEILPA